MNTQNINTTRFFIYIFSFIGFIYQLIILNNAEDFLCILVIFITAILTTHYCFNNNYFFQYPITLLMIFFSCFINLSGALYLKSLEFTLLTEQLKLPLSTIVNLALFNLFIILSHKIYRNLKISIYIKSKINNFLEKFEFYNFEEIKLLYLISIIAIIAKLFYLDLNTPVEFQIKKGVEGPNLLQDILSGLNYLFFLPIVIFFSNSLYKTEHDNKKNLFFIIFILSVIFISLSRSSRSLFFDVMFLTSIIFFILFLFGRIKTGRIFFLKFIIALILVVPTINFLENLSIRFLSQRGEFLQRTPIENVKSFVENIFNYEMILYEKEGVALSESEVLFGENYYNNTIFNRINILLVHDHFNYIKTFLRKKQIDDTKDLQINKIISISPQPIINIFTKNFRKADYNNISTASFLYDKVDYMYGNQSIGSALMTLYIIFGNWIYFLLLFIFIPFFVFFDSFYNSKLMLFNPFILIFFYTTGYGVLNFLSASDISVWFSLVRSVPETLLFVFIFNFFYKAFIKKNLNNK